MIRALTGGRSWREATFVVLDFEATGLDFARDEVVSYGVVPISRGRVDLGGARYRVVRPSVTLHADAVRVHGLTPDALSTAPLLGDVVPELFVALSEGTLVAHAASVELGFLARMYRSAGRRPPTRAIDVLDLVASLARSGDATRPASARLADLAEAYGVPHTRSHHAFSDAMTTALLFLVLATRLERRGIGSHREIERAGRSQNARDFFVGPP